MRDKPETEVVQKRQFIPIGVTTWHDLQVLKVPLSSNQPIVTSVSVT